MTFDPSPWQTHVTEQLAKIIDKENRIMTALDDAVAALQAQDQTLLSTLNTAFADIQAELSSLEAQIAAGNPADAAQAVTNLQAMVTDLQNATSQAQSNDPGPQPSA